MDNFNVNILIFLANFTLVGSEGGNFALLYTVFNKNPAPFAVAKKCYFFIFLNILLLKLLIPKETIQNSAHCWKDFFLSLLTKMHL